jgi:hypothetical protein
MQMVEERQKKIKYGITTNLIPRHESHILGP